MRLGWRRILAWLIDWACILVWAAVTALIGIPLYLAGVTDSAGMLTANLVGALVVVVPVVAAAAWCESGNRTATPGKRACGLRLTYGRRRPQFSVALLRNCLKIGLPWILGHACVYALAAGADGGSSPVPIGVWILTIAAYLIPLVYIVSLFVADGRTPYDRITGTDVVLAPPPRRVEFRPGH